MIIERMKVGGLTKPIGYQLDSLDVSWNVVEARGRRAARSKAIVSEQEDFRHILFENQSEDPFCHGLELELALKPYTRYFICVEVESELGEHAEGITWFETGKMSDVWQADWIGTQPEDSFHPVFQKEIRLDKGIDSARLYACGLGLFETQINGKAVTDEVLMPFVNDYRSRMQVMTFDVTGLLGQGSNLLNVCLGNGWYKGRFGQALNFHYGDSFALIAELRVRYADGTEEIFGTNESWQYRGSDVESSGIYDGEVMNRLLWADKPNPWKSASVLTMTKELLSDRISVPLKVMEKLPVHEILHTPAGETVLDMGQNFAGWIAFRNTAPKGTRIRLEFGEVLQGGSFYNDNYRSATGGFTYVSDGREEWVRPHFTYFGFRYVRVSGWPGELSPDDFVGCAVYSALEQTGSIVTSNEKLNRLILNAQWGQKSNFVDIPTDCPQRDERLGWTADAQIFAPTATYNMDTRAFYRKYMRDIRDAQKGHNGGVPAFVPEGGGGMCPICAVWGDVAVLIPETMRRFYDSPAETMGYYSMMKEWIEYVAANIERHHGSRSAVWDFDFQFGDWLALDGADEQSMKGGTSDAYVATVYYYRTAGILAETAAYLELEEDAKKYHTLAEAIRETILYTWFSPAGHLTENTQTAYILALQFGLYRDKDVLMRDFLALLKRSKYSIKCGFTGAPILCQTLSANGQTALAWQFLLNEEAPGWLHEVDLGATTIWERWNSLLPDGSISGTGMNSLNHYSYGSVVEFLYAYAAGIRPESTGFSKAVIAPQPDGRLKHLSCAYRSPAGRFVSEWCILDSGELRIHIEVPFGCFARVELPESGKDAFTVESGSYDYQYTPLRDYRCLYTPDALLSDVFRDAEARNALLSRVPQAASFEGDATRQVGDLMELAFLGADPAAVQQAIAELGQTKHTI